MSFRSDKSPVASAWPTLLVLLLCVGTANSEDEPEVHVAASAEEIFVGESVDYQVEIRNAKSPSAPDMSAIDADFTVVAKGDQSRNQSSTYIINGRVTQENVFSHVYLYQLTPRKAGRLKIPAPVATIDGATYQGESLPLNVIEPEPQDLVVAEITASPLRVFPTQPLRVTLRVLVRPLPKEGNRDPLSPLRSQRPHLQINWSDTPAGLTSEDKVQWLQPLLAEDGIGFTLNDVSTRTGSLFDGPRLAVFKLPQERVSRDGLDGKPIRYFSYELTRTFQAEQTGQYTFGPAVVKGTFVEGIERGELVGRKLVATAAAVSVEVRDVPTPRPPNYCGAIGDFRVRSTATPATLRVGDPLTLTLELERTSQSGSMDRISAPDLEASPKLQEEFELIDKHPTGRIDGNVKRFSYGLRPRRAGVSIPELTVATFDTETEQFRDLVIPPIDLTVKEADSLSAGEIVGRHGSAAPATLKSQSQGIYQNITDPTQLGNQQTSLAYWMQVSLAIWAAAGTIVAIVHWQRMRSVDPLRLRRSQARRMALQRLSQARQLEAAGKSPEALRQVRDSLLGLAADSCNRIQEGLTAADVANLLTNASVPPDVCAQVRDLLESLESMEYGGSFAGDVASTIDRASALVTLIAPKLERGKFPSGPATTLLPLMFLWMPLVASAADHGSRERTFLQALERFDTAQSAEDYRASAEMLQSLLTDGYQNGAVYYNLGNAWYRAGQFGRAILNYRKAKPFRPRDPYLTANLQQALESAPGTLPATATPWWTHVCFWTEWLAYPTKVSLAVGLSTIAAALVVLAAFLRRPRLHWVAAGLLIAAASVSFDASLSGPDFLNSRRAVITGETVARKGMGATYEPAFNQPLRDGAEFQVINSTSEWTFGHFEGIGDGWVRNEFVAR